MTTRRRIIQSAAAALGISSISAQTKSPGKMRLGVILGISPDPDAAIRRVKELGFPTCQVSPGNVVDDEMAGKLRKALDRYGVEASAVVAGGPGPEIYNFYQGPQ